MIENRASIVPDDHRDADWRACCSQPLYRDLGARACLKTSPGQLRQWVERFRSDKIYVAVIAKRAQPANGAPRAERTVDGGIGFTPIIKLLGIGDQKLLGERVTIFIKGSPPDSESMLMVIFKDSSPDDRESAPLRYAHIGLNLVSNELGVDLELRSYLADLCRCLTYSSGQHGNEKAEIARPANDSARTSES